MSALTVTQRNDLQYLEQQIEKGLQTFIEVGEALWKIREQKLYRESHGTFEAYCKERWGISRESGYKLITESKAAQSVSNLTQNLNRNQASELAKVEPEKRQEVVEQTIEREGKLTARGIQETASSEETVQVLSWAHQYAKFAIQQLEKINNSDPAKIPALESVQTYIQGRLKK